MSELKRSIILTVSDCMNFVSSYAGGSVPQIGDEEYSEWLRWIQIGQQDAANRGFWRRLLKQTTVNIVANNQYITLPDDFYKHNGIYKLEVDGVDWSKPNNKDGITLFPELDFTTNKWKLKILPDAPKSNATGNLLYFANPPVPTQGSDFLILDGEMIAFYVLKEYFRKKRQFGSMDDARIEYENRLREQMSFEMMPTAQEASSFTNISGVVRFGGYNGREGRNKIV